MKLILSIKSKYYLKKARKILIIIAIAFLIITAIILSKYKPIYKVTIGQTEIGYVENKSQFQAALTAKMEEEGGVAYVELEQEPSYELKLVARGEETSEQEVLEKAEENVQPIYTVYGIALDGNVKVNVASEQEAEDIITDLQEEYQDDISLDLKVRQSYSKELPEIATNEEAIATLKIDTIEPLVDQKKKEEQKNLIVAVRPVTGGTITSRYGARSSIRSGPHTGLDIALSKGTPIVACNAGTVKFAGTKGSYGKLVIITHENGSESWYGHCSKLYVTEGQQVEAGEKIAAVGSTGNSTGPHLHFEIRINGKTVNPQNYM